MTELTTAAIEDLEALLDHYPAAAEGIIQAAKEERLRAYDFLIDNCDLDKPCGCLLGITIATAIPDRLRTMMIKHDCGPSTAAYKISEEIKSELDLDSAYFKFENFSDNDHAADIISAVENWQEKRLYAQAQDRGRT